MAGLVAVIGATYAALFPFESPDARLWFIPWLRHIVAEGPLLSISHEMPPVVPGTIGGNYTPPYYYLLGLASLSKGFLSPLMIIKLVGIVGGLLCAGGMYWLLRCFYSTRVAILGAAALLLLPTVAMNIALWGQSDTLYTAFLVMAVGAALRDRWAILLLAFGAALAFKLQAVFLGPFVLYMFIAQRVPVWCVILPAIAYAVFMIPAVLVGRPAMEMLTVYLDQYNTFSRLSMNVPNPWVWIQFFDLVSLPVGIVIGLSLATAGGLAIAAIALRHRLRGSDLLLLAVTSVTLMPYVLPKMQDRYFFPADVLSYSLFLAKPRRWTFAVAGLIQLGSACAYQADLFGIKIGPPIGAVLIGVAVLIISAQLASVLGYRLSWRVIAGRSGRKFGSEPPAVQSHL